MYKRGVIPLSLCTHLPTFWMTPTLFHQVHTQLMDGLFINQKTNKGIRISYSLKHRHSKKVIYEKVNAVQDKINILGSSINQKPNSTMSVMLCTGAIFVKKNSCLVARIVPYDTVGLHLLTFRIIEPYPSKDIALDLSHVILH